MPRHLRCSVRGGLLGQLQANHCRSLPRALPKRDRRDGTPEWAWRHDNERRDREHAEAFTRLFPNAGDFFNDT
jgi:hypothetical protein